MILLEFGNNDLALLTKNLFQPLEEWSEKYEGTRIELLDEDVLEMDKGEIAYLQLYPSTSTYGDASEPIKTYSFRKDGICIANMDKVNEEGVSWTEAARDALEVILEEGAEEIKRVRKVAEGLKEIEEIVAPLRKEG